jgi:exopolysaccharide biosynthesis polyprenyl glycosylphosphotransferase
MLIHAFRLLDQLVLAVTAASVASFVPGNGFLAGGMPSIGLWDLLGLVLLLGGWMGIFAYCIRYRADRFVAVAVQVKDVVKAATLAAFWLQIIATVFSFSGFSAANVLLFWVIVTAFGISARLLLRFTLIHVRRSGYNYRFILVVGANARARGLAERIERRPELGYKRVGYVAESLAARAAWITQGWDPGEILGTLADLQGILQRERVDEILLCVPVESRFSEIMTVVQHARDLGIVVRLLPDVEDGSFLRSLHVEHFEGECVLTLFREQMLFQLLLKRMIDVGVSAVALLLLSPVLLVVGILIKLTSPGPVLFVQNRVGMNQRQFKLYKFRSMDADAEQRRHEIEHLNERDGPAFKISNDPRITPIGRLLRKTSLDELPQLFNVLRGEMSLVGPRPPLPDEVKRYEWLFRKRLSVKPGITCLWQVTGRNHTTFKRWMELDHEYVENWSVWYDCKILLRTIPAVFHGRGAS